MLKKKFLKKFNINIVSPILLDELFKPFGKKKEALYDIERESFILPEYKDNFDLLVNGVKRDGFINQEELLYLNVVYKPNDNDDKSKKEDDSKTDGFVFVMHEYIMDKEDFAELLETLRNECEYYQFSKTKKTGPNFVFKTSIDHIRTITRNLIIANDV
jgi:hypothetical protein